MPPAVSLARQDPWGRRIRYTRERRRPAGMGGVPARPPHAPTVAGGTPALPGAVSPARRSSRATGLWQTAQVIRAYGCALASRLTHWPRAGRSREVPTPDAVGRKPP